MLCRVGCGACCIAPSISSFIPGGMPHGKPAGIRCVQLDDKNRCLSFGSPQRPNVCSQFTADIQICGKSTEEALLTLRQLEAVTSTGRNK